MGKKSVLAALVLALSLGALAGCGGGGSGDDDPAPVKPEVPTTVTGPNTTADDASTADKTYAIAARSPIVAGDNSYTYNIAGFGSGDVLDFAAGVDPTIVNSDWPTGADNSVDVQWAFGNGVATMHLTGLTQAQDAAINGVTSFKAQFGSASIK